MLDSGREQLYVVFPPEGQVNFPLAANILMEYVLDIQGKQSILGFINLKFDLEDSKFVYRLFQRDKI